MARCPVCGKWIWSALFVGPGSTVCSKCGAKLGTDPNDMFGLGLMVIEYPPGYDVGRGDALTEAEAKAKWRSDHSNYNEQSQGTGAGKGTVEGDKAKWGHCNHCHAVIMLSNAKFCSNCGSGLRHRYDATPYWEEEKANVNQRASAKAGNGEKCMVCHLELNRRDDVAWCPSCGSPAHKKHLLEWIHVKSRCPVCRMSLREKDF